MEKKFEQAILKKEKHIAVITLNRPEKLNAWTHQLFDDVLAALEDVRSDDNIRVLVITGAGKGFCSGGDVDEFESWLLETSRQGPEVVRRYVRTGPQRIIRAIRDLDRPVIAMVNGMAVGSGMDLAVACDIRTGCEKSKFMSGFERLGLIHGMGALWLLPRIIGVAKTAELAYTCDFIDADEAYRIGLLNKLWQSSELEKETMAMARRIASRAPIAVRMSRLLIFKGLHMDFETALEFTATCQGIAGPSEDHAEAYHALIEKRQGVFKGK